MVNPAAPLLPGAVARGSESLDSVSPAHDCELLALSARLGHTFGDLGLLRRAVAHRSWCSETMADVASNERLEFLGDSVLGLVVTVHSYHRYPDLAESQLSPVRAAVVNSASLAEVATEIDLGAALLLGRGEDASGGRSKASILADALEAVIGAVYIDAGWREAQRIITALLADRIDLEARGPGRSDFKSQLQELAARLSIRGPEYRLAEEGPDHRKRFRAQVLLDGTVAGTGDGRTKKQAEQRAAEQAWERLVAEQLAAQQLAAEPLAPDAGPDLEFPSSPPVVRRATRPAECVEAEPDLAGVAHHAAAGAAGPQDGRSRW
jgi:ribonuclease-3